MDIANVVFTSVALTLEIGLTAILLRRKVHGQFPLFFIFTVYSVVATGTQLAAIVSNHYRVFFIVYWANDAGFALLSLLALYETFRRVFGALYHYRWFWLLFPGAVF